MPSSYNIGSRYEDLIRELVKSGRYMSASEVMRAFVFWKCFVCVAIK
jgi:Arc/MetJ-type ribon-helix-helix transcriptional regulator